MHALLITVNILLSLVAIWSVADIFIPESKPAANVYSVKKRTGKRAENNQDAAAAAKNEPQKELQTGSTEEQIKRIITSDVFNPERSPNAGVRRGNARLEMTLAGTFQMGNVSGAIILQRNIQRQINPFIQMMMGGPPGGNGGGGGDNFAPGGGFNSGRNIGFSGSRNNRGGSRREGGRNSRFQRFAPTQQNSSTTNNNVLRQYVRIGETLANGYTLVAVTRTTASLVRGGDKLELELQDPSKNASRRGNTQQRMSVDQQLKQAQMFSQMRMMQMMQQMQNNNGGGRQGGRRNSGRGR